MKWLLPNRYNIEKISNNKKIMIGLLSNKYNKEKINKQKTKY